MRLTMRRQILIAFFAFIVGPTLVALFVTQRITYSLFEDRVLRYSAQLTNQVTRAIDAHLANYRSLTLQPYFNSDLLEAITDVPPERWASEAVIASFLQGFVNSDRHISTAYMIGQSKAGSVYDMETAIVQGMPYLDVIEYLSANHRRIASSRGRMVWLATRELRSVFGHRYNTFAAVRPIRRGDETVALLVILFREDFFRDRYRDVSLESDGSNYFVANGGMIVSSNDSSRIGNQMSDELTSRLFARSSGWFLVDSPDERYIAHSRSRVTDWMFVSEISRAALLADIVPVRNVMLLIALLFMLFMAWLGNNVSKRITSPLRVVQDGIHRIGQGDLTVQIPHAGDGDIAELAGTVNRLTSQLSELLERVTEEERVRQRDRLRFLQMQLSPHFIYNSLNTIRWMAIINRQENIKAMIDALIKLMRNVSSPDEEYTTLARELSLLRSYAYIQQMRFPNFVLEVDVPERLGNARINKFVLQNLVENSIVHGFPDRSHTGEVHVSAREEEHDLVLEVRDNGIGFTPTDTRSSNDEEHNQTGIASIQERIFLVYGGNYGLEIESAPGTGTVARVRVPLMAEAEEEVECGLQ